MPRSGIRPIVTLRSTAGTDVTYVTRREPAQPPRPAGTAQVRPGAAPPRRVPSGAVISRRCQLTGRQPGFGKIVSHSHRRTSRRWDPNLPVRRLWLPSENRYARLRLSVMGIKFVDRLGVEAAVARLRARGERI
jgi:large subunit ribosomal protein L28